jgi:hypothetical protein
MSELSKIVIDLEADAWHGYATETVWAENLSEGVFRIRNIPFYAKEVSVGDDVLTEYRDENHHLKFVTKRGGHSTYRIFLGEEVTAEIFRKYWEPLEKIGCTYEKGQGRLIAVDVPPTTDIYHTYALLEEGEKDSIWEFEEGHCGHPANN